MLYVTTRNHQDTFTTHQVLTQNSGHNGGLYVPLHIPTLTGPDLNRLLAMSFGQCVAEILNLFLSTKLTGWDIDFSIGRYPIRLNPLAHRIIMAETWHNPDWQYTRLEQNLRKLIGSQEELPGNWVSIAVRMAVLAGILGNQEILGNGSVDIAVVSGDFSLPISAWYLRKMGFPVGNIICCCNENNQFWNLICNGQIRTEENSISTLVPEADVTVPANLEHLIYQYFGLDEAKRFACCCETGAVYSVSDSMLQQLRTGIYASVVSSSRVETAIPNVCKTHHYILHPSAALAYSGFLDYRAKSGMTGAAVVLSDTSPVCAEEIVAKAMNIPVEELEKLL